MRLLQFGAGQPAASNNDTVKTVSESNDPGLTVTSHSISLRAGFISLDFNWSRTETSQKSMQKETVSATPPPSAGQRVSALRRRADLAALLDPSPSAPRQKTVSRQNFPHNVALEVSTKTSESKEEKGKGPLTGRCFTV
jgi:hypothetical protein